MSETPAERTTGARASVELLRRNRDFRRLFVASVISLGGDWFLFVALGGLLLEATGTGHGGGNHDLRAGGPGLPRDAVGGVAGRPPGPAAAHDRLRPGAHGDLRVVPAGGSRQPVARLRAARDAVDLRRGVRPRLVGGAAQRRRPRGPADRQRAQRLALGHDARGRRGGRWRRRHAVRSERRVRRSTRRRSRSPRCCCSACTEPFPSPASTTSTSGSPRPPARPCATPDRIAVSGPSCR